MKRAGDRYPHKPSPGHTLDEVLKSLRDLIRNDLAAPAPPPINEPPPSAPPPQDDVVLEGANPDPSAHELVDEVVAGLERELAELDDIDAGDGEREQQAAAESEEMPDDDADAGAGDLPATEDVEFIAEAESEAEEIQFETAVDDDSNAAIASPDAEVVDPDASEEMILTEDIDASHSESAPELVPDDENVGRPSTRHVGLKADLQPLDSHEADVSMDDSGSMAITDSEAYLVADPEIETGSVDLDALDAEPDPPTAPPPAGARERQTGIPAGSPGERLRESLALIAPDDADSFRASVQPTPQRPPPESAPIPEADAIPVLDQALDSHLPLDFQVRCRAIAIQATARFDRDMRREGRAPLSPDLVAHLARILEQALAQEFPERATTDQHEDPQDS